MRVAVVGASGFVGSSVVAALRARGADVVEVKAPRLPPFFGEVDRFLHATGSSVQELADRFAGCAAVINAAGNPDASSAEEGLLLAANGILPLLALRSCRRAGVPHFVHISSAVVQGRLRVLDETRATETFSAYSRSKALAEQLLLEDEGEAPRVVIYRPPSVHGPDRRITKALTRIASSPLSSVSRPGTDPTPQAHILNVADAVAFLAMTEQKPPSIVIHPWEGFTTAEFLRLLGGREPILLPSFVTRALTGFLRRLGTVLPPFAANARRLEMMWAGQRQVEGWLITSGWKPPVGKSAWRATLVPAERHNNP